jgi:hypothetical protein
MLRVQSNGRWIHGAAGTIPPAADIARDPLERAAAGLEAAAALIGSCDYCSSPAAPAAASSCSRAAIARPLRPHAPLCLAARRGRREAQTLPPQLLRTSRGLHRRLLYLKQETAALFPP